MYNIAVCDDDQGFLDILSKKLEEYNDVCIFTFYTNPLLLKKEILKYDAVFIDYDMPEENAYHFFDSLQDIDIEKVVITNYDTVVYKGFKYGFFWFVRKEYLDMELPEMMERLIVRLKQSRDRLNIDTVNRQVSIPYREIQYIETEHNYIIIHGLADYKVRYSFSTLLSTIKSELFIVPIYGVIVNLKYVTFVNYTKATIHMLDGTIINISRSKKKEVFERYRNYLSKIK